MGGVAIQHEGSAGANIVRRAYELFNQGNSAEAAALFAPDTVWHFPGTSALAGVCEGPEALMGLGPKMAAMSNGTLRPTLLDVAESEKYVVAIQPTQAERDGQAADHVTLQPFTVRHHAGSGAPHLVEHPNERL